MARPLRNDFAGALHHLTSRGNNKGDIFLDDDDRLRFLALLAATVIRFGWRLDAWVLMTNHFHLEVETPEANLSRGMHWLNTRYVQWFNRKHDRCGHLFQRRFEAKLIEKESYMLEVARYVILNPVRAHMVTPPGVSLEQLSRDGRPGAGSRMARRGGAARKFRQRWELGP